jgi:predicted O-methyltransferase YrrM
VLADKDTYLKLWENEKSSVYPEIQAYVDELGYEIDKDWMDDLALHTQITVKSSALCYQHGNVLYAALRQYLKTHGSKAPVTIYETGTARGFSSMVMAKALQDGGHAGRILTFDILPHNTPIYWNCIADLDGKKSRAEILEKWRGLSESYVSYVEGDSRINLQRVVSERVHFAFLDGAHSFKDVMYEFSNVVARQQSSDMIVFDDYNHQDFSGLVQAVDEGCELFGYDKRIVTGGGHRAYVVAIKKA